MTSYAARNLPAPTIFRDPGGRVQRLTYSKPVEAGLEYALTHRAVCWAKLKVFTHYL